MKGLKYHLAMILPLFLVLFCVEFSVILERIVKDYEVKMSRDYNIIIVSKAVLTQEVVSQKIPAFESLAQVDPKRASQRLKDELSEANYNKLINALPNFYSLKLIAYPTPLQMNSIRSELLKIEGVTRVETFSDTHDKVYKILQLLSYFFIAFIVIVGVLVSLVLSRQIQIWLYANRQKMEIMRLCGASYIYRSIGLYFGGLIYSGLSAVLVCVAYIFAVKNGVVIDILDSLGFTAQKIFRLKDVLTLFSVAFGLCTLAVMVMMAKAK